jgi:hypothetical protein
MAGKGSGRQYNQEEANAKWIARVDFHSHGNCLGKIIKITNWQTILRCQPRGPVKVAF